MKVKLYTAESWCPACRTVVPKLKELLESLGIPYEVIDCDKDENYNECMTISALPAVRILKDSGVLAYEGQGNQNFEQILRGMLRSEE